MPKFGVQAVALIPPDNLFAIVGRVSPGTCVLEIRNAASGRLSQSLAFESVQRPSRPKAKSGAIALHTPQALKVWRLPSSAPHFDLACDSFHLAVAARIENTSKVITNVQSSGKPPKVELREAAEKDHSKQSQWQVKGYLARGSLDGSRLIIVDEGKCAAYRYDSNSSGFEELWAPKAIPYLSGIPGDGWAIHPTEDRVWTRRVVFEFSSGRILSEVKNPRALREILTKTDSTK